jgi:dynein heavy chain, axonemal
VSRTIKPPKVHIHSMNPKSVSIGKLYGDYEKVGDWADGILGLTVRDAAADKSEDTHWVMLDGPVDTLWIENLNTVLDDNKKLCLISGEIIKMTQKMTMMFEVEDLQEASPATVSRCGMVYVTPEKLGWEPLFHKWIASLPEGLKADGMHNMYI